MLVAQEARLRPHACGMAPTPYGVRPGAVACTLRRCPGQFCSYDPARRTHAVCMLGLVADGAARGRRAHPCRGGRMPPLHPLAEAPALPEARTCGG